MHISIITPVYNGESVISDAMQSMSKQSHSNWEWIIVNDGSSDKTGEILKSFNDSRIKIIHQPNRGASLARNRALEVAKGDYITFLDADDVLPSDALAVRCAKLMNNHNVDLVHGGVKITMNGKTLRRYRADLTPGPLLGRLARLEEGVFFGVNYMVRSSKIGGARFIPGLTHSEDLLFYLKLAHDNDLQYCAVDREVYEYRIRDGSAMSNINGLENGYLELLKRSQEMGRIDVSDLRAQRKRVQSILFRSWLRKGKPLRAASAIVKVHRLCTPCIRAKR